MLRIPALYLRDPVTGLATSELDPQNAWVAEGRGVATRKWDGVPCLIDDEYEFYRGLHVAKNLELPQTMKVDSTLPNGDRFGWVPVPPNGVAEAIYIKTIESYIKTPGVQIAPGTYELCGPGVKGNHERLDRHWLYRHDGMVLLTAPRVYEQLIWYLGHNDLEGIVWKYGPCSAQITRKDVGLSWPHLT